MIRHLAFLRSLSSRIVLLLTIGMTTAAFGALLIAEAAQRHYYHRRQFETVVNSAADIAGRLADDPVVIGTMLASDEILGARTPPPGIRVTAPDPELTDMLRARFGAEADPRGQAEPGTSCFPVRRFNWRIQAAGIERARLPVCWVVEYRDKQGVERTIGLGMPRFVLPPPTTLEPLYLVLLLGTSALLAVVIARAATAPLRRLTRAAHTFSIVSDPEPIPEQGPSEVRTAIATFNLMQSRVRDGLRERTQILAAISHDLQTPLTRLRLRLEQVQDEALREKLIADVIGTHKLVREGLDLAQSSESTEEWQVVGIDSLLASLAEDAAEFGADIKFSGGCGEGVRTKPDAMIRCLTNLVDNAIKYGGSADIRCTRRGDMIEIEITDRGQGLPDDMLERMFDPFVRAETSRSRSTGGTGLGLTIARAQAKLFEGRVSLSNKAGGGLTARVSVPSKRVSRHSFGATRSGL